MRDLEDFLVWVQPYCPAAPYPAMERAVLDAAIELARKSTILREDLTPIDIQSGVTAYTLSPPDAHQIVVPKVVRLSGQPVYPKGEDGADHAIPGWRSGGLSRRYWMSGPTTINLMWTPTTAAAGALTVKAAVKPAQNATSLADMLYDDWAQGIAHGALQLLFGMDGEPWANPEKERSRKRKFEDAVAEASAVAATSYTDEPMRVRARPLA